MSESGDLKTKYVERQAGGHFAANGDTLMPNLQRSDGTFLKLIRDSPRYFEEVTFYRNVFSLVEDDNISQHQNEEKGKTTLKNLIPRYYGIFKTYYQGQELQYLILEDLTRRLQMPCVLDIKLKADIHDPNSQNCHPVFPVATKLGFLIDGITFYNMQLGCYQSFGKSLGRNLSENEVKLELLKYVNGHRGIILSFIERLKSIEFWARQQRSYHFYRSSLLFVYDAEDIVDHSLFKVSNVSSDVRLIDFAKVYYRNDNDILLATSLQRLRMVFEDLANE
ncbi:hypothetical protein CHUAL_000820 [Chamberlinius hualienensis]